MERKPVGRPRGSVVIQDSREVKFLVDKNEFSVIQRIAKKQGKSEAAVLREMIGFFAAAA